MENRLFLFETADFFARKKVPVYDTGGFDTGEGEEYNIFKRK